jgi:hypothetical protein
VTVEADADYYERVIRGGLSLSGYEANRLFVNLGGLRFADLSFASGLDSTLDGRGTGLGDFDRDGDTDILQANTKEKRIVYYRNDTPTSGHFVRVRLRGEPPNTKAIGAVVTLRFGGKARTQMVACGSGFNSQSTTELLFGIGEATEVDELIVAWPGPKRRTSRFASPPTDSLLAITQGKEEIESRRLRPRNFNRDVVAER